MLYLSNSIVQLTLQPMFLLIPNFSKRIQLLKIKAEFNYEIDRSVSPLTSKTHVKLKLGNMRPMACSKHLQVKMSPAKRSCKSIYCNLTATFSSSCVTALWTWASEAAAIGLQSNSLNISLGNFPNSSWKRRSI